MLLVLWLNAVATLALAAAQLAVVLRAGYRVIHAERRVSVLVDCALSPSTAIVASASTALLLWQRAFRRRLHHRMRAT